MKAAWIRLILKSLGKVLNILGVGKWLKNKWYKEKKKNMGLKQISGSTQVVFTVKTFIAFIIAMLSFFYGFYQLVVVPRMNTTDAMIIEQKEQNKATASELIKINTSIGTLTGTLQVLVQEKSTVQASTNTGGSFSNNSTSKNTDNSNTRPNTDNSNSGSGRHLSNGSNTASVSH
jgi:hypothetical protein